MKKATAWGFVAVLLWALLALLTAASGDVPPFQLVSMSFTVAFLAAALKWLRGKENVTAHLRQPAAAWLVGVGGLFGYHFFYFLALRNAPAVEASLIAYLWPLLIVLLSAGLPGEKLRWWHVLGALAGLLGAGILVTRGQSFTFDTRYVLGYLAALACAFIWSGYSVLSRRFAAVPTDTVGGFCGVTALLAALAHLVFEQTVWPASVGQWLAVLGLGLGPVGLAFFFWDHGVKRGHIQALGASSYAAPLLSTMLLIIFGFGELRWSVAAACLLIVGGAVLASLDLLRPQSEPGRARPIE
jgi:drug/metabolite transporter (DMT)-like permease